jgi:hypothetical protein
MRRRVLAVLLVVAGLSAQAADGRTPRPVVERAAKGTQCVEPAEAMRRNHMDFLKHQRDDTVHGGVRGAKYGLKECIDCHASPTTGSVARSPSNFCVSCHEYTAVRIDCFECHSTRARPVVQQGVTQ